MQRRLLLVASVALALFLIYCVNYLGKLSAENTAGWARPWQSSKDNAPESEFAAAPVPEVPEAPPSTQEHDFGVAPVSTLEEPAPPPDPLPLDKPFDTTTAEDTTSSHLNEEVYEFMEDVAYPQPSLDLSTLAHYRPHNLASTGQHPTYATYFSSRNTSLHDPYFAATLQLVYRTLWNPTSASTKYPFTVFVAPFIPYEQRVILAGAGANIVELPLVEWEPTEDIYGRWKDLFSKLHMWNQTQFSRITFLDGDAFPMQNIDDVFEISTPQKCIRERLEKEDLAREKEICDYVFAGVEMMNMKQINGGMAVLAPNTAMHARLLRNMDKTDQYDSKMVEQGYLNWQFSVLGPFPTNFIPRAYNGFFPQPDERNTLKVVHEKLWSIDTWGEKTFDTWWKEMLMFYDSSAFLSARQNDGTS